MNLLADSVCVLASSNNLFNIFLFVLQPVRQQSIEQMDQSEKNESTNWASSNRSIDKVKQNRISDWIKQSQVVKHQSDSQPTN